MSQRNQLFIPLCSGFLFILLLLSGSESNAQENSKATTFINKDITWNPCPPFMLEGCQIAILNGDPAENHLDVFFKVPPNYKIPHHYHTSPERMILVSGELTVRYDGEKKTVLKPGMYAYGPAEKPHVATCADGDPCVLFIAFIEPLDAFPVSPAK